MNPDDNPFWGEPTPTDLWDDMDRLNGLYEELGWDHTDYLDFKIEGNELLDYQNKFLERVEKFYNLFVK